MASCRCGGEWLIELAIIGEEMVYNMENAYYVGNWLKCETTQAICKKQKTKKKKRKKKLLISWYDKKKEIKSYN